MANIVVIDDEANIRGNLCSFLELKGHEIVEADSGQYGIELVRKFMPDLVFCDLMMPEVDGYGVLAAIRDDPVTERIPFVFITASAEKSEAKDGIARGANAYIIKPFTLDQIADVLAELLPETV